MVGVSFLLCVLALAAYWLLWVWSPYGDDLVQEKYVFATQEHHLPVNYLAQTSVVASKQWVREDLLQILTIVVPLLAQSEVTWWVARSTLWGALLVQGMLPWEDHAELEVEFSQAALASIVKLRQELVVHNLGLCKCDSGYIIHRLNVRQFPFVRVTFIAPRGAAWSTCGPLSELNECTFARAHVYTWEKSDLFPLQTLRFEKLDVFAPKEAVKYVRGVFGNDALDTAPNRGNVWCFNSMVHRLFRCA